eukprot:UN17581
MPTRKGHVHLQSFDECTRSRHYASTRSATKDLRWHRHISPQFLLRERRCKYSIKNCKPCVFLIKP